MWRRQCITLKNSEYWRNNIILSLIITRTLQNLWRKLPPRIVMYAFWSLCQWRMVFIKDGVLHDYPNVARGLKCWSYKWLLLSTLIFLNGFQSIHNCVWFPYLELNVPYLAPLSVDDSLKCCDSATWSLRPFGPGWVHDQAGNKLRLSMEKVVMSGDMKLTITGNSLREIKSIKKTLRHYNSIEFNWSNQFIKPTHCKNLSLSSSSS